MGILALSFWAVSLVWTPAAQAEPELKTVMPEGTVRVDRPFDVQCEVRWTGDAGEYSVMPVELDSFDWGTATLGPVEASVEDGVNVVRQRVTITPAKAGEFKLPELRVGLQSPGTPPVPKASESPTHPSSPSATPTLRSQPPSVTVKPHRPLAWMAGIPGALLLIGAGTWWARRRRAARPARVSSPTSAAVTPTAAESALLTARQRRIEGDVYACYSSLLVAAEALPGVADELKPRLEACARDAGYRGWRPENDELDSDIRAVERALRKAKEERES